MKLSKTMKLASLTVVAGATLFLSTGVAQAEKENPLLKGTMSKMEVSKSSFNELAMFKKARISVERFSELNGMYLVEVSDIKGNVFPLYVSKNLKMMIHSGTAIKTDSGVEVKAPISMDDVKGFEQFTYGTGATEIFVFTDPECPYCKKFEQQWEGLKDKYTMRVFMYPLSFHKKAVPMTYWILDGKTDEEKAQRLLAIANGSTEFERFNPTLDQKREFAKELDKVKSIAQKNGITGTPTVLDGNGERMNWTQL